MLSKIFFSFCVFLIIAESQKICEKVNIASNASLYKDDMVRKGKVDSKWIENSQTPILIEPVKAVDYIYINVFDYEPILNVKVFNQVSNFNLSFSDHYFADSRTKIDTLNRSNSDREYAFEVAYNCKEAGGALIDVFIFYLVQIGYSGTQLWKCSYFLEKTLWESSEYFRFKKLREMDFLLMFSLRE